MLPWLNVGDFNEIMGSDDKLRGVLRPFRQIENFREAVVECEMIELKLNGGSFTWSKRKGLKAIFERLDHGLAIEGWFSLFPLSTEVHLSSTISDHVPFLIQLGNHSRLKRGFKSSFRFENMWARDVACKELIMGCWTGRSNKNFKDLANSMRICSQSLAKWNKEVYGNL